MNSSSLKNRQTTIPGIFQGFAAFVFTASLFIPTIFYGETEKGELVREISESNFQSEVVDSKKPVLVDFWATWCGPCRMYGPIVDKVAKDYAGRLKVVRIDIDQNPQLARAFQIEAIPASFLFKNGKVVTSWVGLISEEELKDGVKKVVKAAPQKRKHPSASSTPLPHSPLFKGNN